MKDGELLWRNRAWGRAHDPPDGPGFDTRWGKDAELLVTLAKVLPDRLLDLIRLGSRAADLD